MKDKSVAPVDAAEVRRKLGYLGAEEVCAVLGIEPGTLKVRISTGTAPPSHKVGHEHLFPISDFNAWIQASSRQQGGDMRQRPPDARKPAAGRASRGFQRRQSHHILPVRSAQNWLLDAATSLPVTTPRHVAVSSLEACTTPARVASSQTRTPARQGRHRTTLNDNCHTSALAEWPHPVFCCR